MAKGQSIAILATPYIRAEKVEKIDKTLVYFSFRQTNGNQEDMEKKNLMMSHDYSMIRYSSAGATVILLLRRRLLMCGLRAL